MCELDLTLNDINTVVGDGTLNRRQGLLLTLPIRFAQFHMEADRQQPAARALNRFIRHRDFFVEWGILHIDEAVTPGFYIPDLILEGWVPEPP